MRLRIEQSDRLKRDFANQFTWYLDAGGPDLARRFQVALDQSLSQLARKPDLGRPRHFRDSRLHGLRSFPIGRPFHRILIFYRIIGGVLQAVRLMHGARNLPRRLSEPPSLDA